MARDARPTPFAAQLTRVRERIAEACKRSGRSTQSVRLLAVTKSLDVEATWQLVQAGVHDLGENRVEALEHKRNALADRASQVRWHMIGHIQRRKLRRLLDCSPALIHSIDSMRLLESLLRRLEERPPKRPQPVLLQVNVSGEASKGGFEPGELAPALERVSGRPELEVRGLMTMAPLVEDPEQARPVFRALRKLRDALSSAPCPLEELSMGMSNDFEVAIEEGASIVRIGRALTRPLTQSDEAD